MRCVSLFSGCGGLDLGASQAGFDVVFANDDDPFCKQSHETNFPGSIFFPKSITEVNRDVLRQCLGDVAPGDIDLLIGGPPCPPFSKSRFYLKDKPRALEDPLGLETLTGYLSVLHTLKPKAFLLENVPGMAYKVHKGALDLLLATAAEEGYKTSMRILNAADYGVPQSRRRFFLVGLRDRPFEFPAQTHAKGDDDSLFSSNLPRWRTAGEAIGDLDTEESADDTGHFAGGQHHELLRQIPPGQNYLFFTEERGHQRPVFKWRSRYWSFLLKLSPGLPSWTIQARRSNNMGPFHWRNRILRVEEVKRLQSFPDGFWLSGKVEQQWRQVGNAVPPLLAFHLCRAIADQLR